MRVVMIADGDRQFLQKADEHISSLGFFAATAPNSHHLFRLLGIVKPDIVFVSDSLEDEKVTLTCEKLIAKLGYMVPIVVMAEKGEHEDSPCSLRIEKPVNLDRLRNVILNVSAHSI